MKKSRLIIKLNDGEMCKAYEYDGVKQFDEHYRICDPGINVMGYSVQVGFVHLTNIPVVLIDSNEKDVKDLTDDDVFNIWSISISSLMYWYAKGEPFEDYQNIMKGQFNLMYKFIGETSLLSSLNELYVKLNRAKTRPSYSKVRRRYVGLMYNAYIIHFKLALMKLLGIM